MENTINVAHSITTIKVNARGDEIKLDLDDQEFVGRLVDTTERFSREAGELKTTHEKNGDLKAVADETISLCRRWKTALDELLGAGSCEKIFGDITPSVSAFADFFDQLGDILRREQRNRSLAQNERIKKYTEKYSKYHKGG